MTVNDLLLRSFNAERAGILLIQDGKIAASNRSFSELTGHTPEDLAGQTLADLLNPVPAYSGETQTRLKYADGSMHLTVCTVDLDEESGTIRFPETASSLGAEVMAERLETILDITRQMSTSQNWQDSIAHIATACRRLVDATNTTICRLNKEEDTIIPIYTDDEEWRDNLLDFRIPVGTGLTGHVVKTGRPMIVNDPDNSDVVAHVPGTPEEDTEVLMALPLRAGEQILGAITTTRPLSRPFDQSDLEIISILASQVSGILATNQLLEKLSESEIKYRTLVNNADVGLFRLSIEGELLATNDFFGNLLNLPPKRTPGIRDIWGSDRVYQEFLQEVKREGQVRSFNCRTMSVDGRLLELSISSRSFADYGYIEGVVHNVTEQRRLELENQNRLGFLENLIGQIPVALLVLDPDGSPTLCNTAFERMFCITRREMMLEHGDKSLTSRLLREVKELGSLWRSCLRGEDGEAENVVLPASICAGDEGEIRASIHAFPVQNAIGNLTEVVLLFEDTSSRHALQNHLMRVQKLESVGNLAGGLANDFNNVLNGIMGNTARLHQLVKGRNDEEQELRVIAEGIRQASLLTQQLLSFASQGPQRLERLQLNAVFDRTVDLFGARLPMGVQLETEYGQSLPQVMADALQIEQVLLNLLMNASDALSGRTGKITVRTRLRSVRESDLVNSPELRPGHYVELEVQDTGIGIPPEVQDKIFDPFFTTRADQGRSGLGLATVYSIVASHQGHIEVASKPSLGTRFRILIPVPEDASLQLSDDDNGNALIMIVDDEEVIREMLKKILVNLGYDVITFGSGREAVDHYRVDSSSIDAVILDVIMPDMNGIEVYEELRAIRQDVKIMICSGYTQSQRQSILDLPGIHGFLEKPFTIDSLDNSLRTLLGR